MSGICGVVALDGGVAELGPMPGLLERRGPDGTHRWTDGSAALGHTLLATTPEALIETLPLTDAPSGCTITADVRLDNREELLAALGLTEETRTIGDGELILRAYLRWGEDCPIHLLGDFAFAIWDPRHQRLFCARDHMGMRQFNYCYLPDELFAFATVDTALLSMDGVDGTIDERRIADLIADLEGVDYTSTFFRHIHRLAPAHRMSIDADRCRVSRYWTLGPERRLELPDDETYQSAFMGVFTEAVRCRLRASGGVGAMLSGGLDSSSVVAVAARLLAETGQGPLKTVSAVNEELPDCPETRAIRSMLSIDGLDPILVRKGDFGGKRDALVAEMDAVRNPFEVNMTMLRSIYMAACDHGLKVVLDGGAGDVTLTSNNRIAALLGKGRVRQAWRDAKAAQSFWKIPATSRYVARELASAAWVAFAPVRVRRRWRTIRVSRPFPTVDAAFARRVRLGERQLREDQRIDMRRRGDSARRTQAIAHPNLASGRERYDQVAGSFGIEARDPFMDLRVIRFCLSLPPEQLLERGWPKLILRRAIETIVPCDIAWRTGKEHLGGDFTVGLLETWPQWSDSMRADDSPLCNYVAGTALERLREPPGSAPENITLRLFALDRFLRRFKPDKIRRLRLNDDVVR